jgi:Flp pilus assembly CpaE family ATPase
VPIVAEAIKVIIASQTGIEKLVEKNHRLFFSVQGDLSDGRKASSSLEISLLGVKLYFDAAGIAQQVAELVSIKSNCDTSLADRNEER